MKLKMIATVLALTLPTLSASHVAADTGKRTADSGDAKEARESLQRATEVYKSIAQDSKHKIPASVLGGAKCVAIFPDAVTVSLGVGGVHSDGVAFCKSGANDWGNPMFLNMTGGSIGVQAGVKSTDVVMYLTGDRAVNNLKAGKFTVGGEVSAVAGSFDETFRPSAAEVVAYTRTEGLFAGASIDGVNVSRDRDDEMAMYGTEYSTSAKLPEDAERLVKGLKDDLRSNLG